MSDHSKTFSNYLKIKTIQTIEQLDLPIMQKHHVRILAHCLAILKDLSSDNSFSSNDQNLLKEWCDKKSQKFNDQKFNDLLYEQLFSTSKKLNAFSKKLGKNIRDLNINDLVCLVQESQKNEGD